MKHLSIYSEKYHLSNEDDFFDFFMTNLTDSIKYWDYFVNWEKVDEKVRSLEVDLHTINYLVGKDDTEKELRFLLKKYPTLVKVFPILLACREKDFKVLTSYTNDKLVHETFTFDLKQTNIEIDKVVKFARETGLLELFAKRVVKSIPDYVTGIEVGLGSNGRKNRGGTAMEDLVEGHVREVSKKYNYPYLKEATPKKIKQAWGINVKVDKASRRFDFAILKNEKLFLFETNFYGGGGSKLKATAGEYKGLFDLMTEQSHTFIWVTDGVGWNKARKSLQEAFEHIDFLFNIKMLMGGILDEVIRG